MGFKIKIVRTQEELSKADENEILRTLAGAFNEHHGYCKSLFTVEFLRWVQDQIAMDLAPDMWAAFAEAHKERGEYAQEHMELNAKIESLQNSMASKHAALAEAIKQTEAFKADLAELEDAREALANQEAMIEELRKEKDGWSKTIAQLSEQAQTFHVKLRDANNTVLRLKARLYDLEHPEEAAA